MHPFILHPNYWPLQALSLAERRAALATPEVRGSILSKPPNYSQLDGVGASIPTFLLTHWARDRKRGARIPIEELVENQTRRTAQCYGLFDRGVIAPGLKADINIIDFDALHIHAPRLVYDLPAEGKRFVQDITGYHSTICSGQVIYRHGEATGKLPGKLIRGPQAAPQAAASIGT